MNKPLMAMAVAGAFVAPAAVHAQNSTVQVYGKATMEYGYANQGGGRPNSDVFQAPGGSSVGFRGEEKLGGGLSAWFQCESSADVRGLNQDGFCSRNSAIGLKGAFGNLHFGRWDTPFKRAAAVGTVGATETGLMGSAFLTFGNSTSTAVSGGEIGTTGAGTGSTQGLNRNVWKRRESSLTYYESPTFSGFQVLAAFSAANATAAVDASTAAKARVSSISGLYSNGPLSLGLGYERHSDFGSVGGGNDDHAWTIGAAYTFAGKIKVGAQYIDQHYETSSVTTLTKKNWHLGLNWNIAGPHNLDAAYVVAGSSKGLPGSAGIPGGNGAIAGPSALGLSTGAKQYEIAYRYEFSKRTFARFGYVHLNNDNGASYSLGGLAAPLLPGTSQSAWVLYSEHKW